MSEVKCLFIKIAIVSVSVCDIIIFNVFTHNAARFTPTDLFCPSAFHILCIERSFIGIIACRKEWFIVIYLANNHISFKQHFSVSVCDYITDVIDKSFIEWNCFGIKDNSIHKFSFLNYIYYIILILEKQVVLLISVYLAIVFNTITRLPFISSSIEI